MIREIFEKGIMSQIKRGNQAEAKKRGLLRAGNTGMVNERGEIIGSCAATTYLRMVGVNGKPVTLEKELMFAGGRLNEDHWMSVLKEGYDGPILAEEEIATRWETSQGIPVTGRPDIVLCKEEAVMETRRIVPVCGIELKQNMSGTTAYNVQIKREPQLKHLMQAAHYMWQLNCPFELWYTNRCNLDATSWMAFSRKFPKPSDGVPVNYRYYRRGEINPKTDKPYKHKLTKTQYLSGEYKKTFYEPSALTPFIQGFKLAINDGVLYYQDVYNERAGWTKTIVNIPDIQRFYEYVGELKEYGKVPKPALNLTPSGDKIGWKFSDYSDLGDLDPEHCQGQNLNEWVEQVRKKLNNS